MTQFTSRNPSPTAAASAASAAAPSPSPSPSRRRGPVILGVGLLIAAAVVTAVIVTNRDGRPPAAPDAVAALDRPGLTQVQAVASGAAGPADRKLSAADEQKFKQVLEETEHLDQTVFAREVESQQYEEYFIRVWDDFRASRDKMGLLAAAAAFESFKFGAPDVKTDHDWDVTVTRYGAPAESVDPAGWGR